MQNSLLNMFQILWILQPEHCFPAQPYPASVISKLGYRTLLNFISPSLFPLELPDLSYRIACLSALGSPPHRSVPTNIPRFMGRSLWPCKAYRSSSVYSLPTMRLHTHRSRNTMFHWGIAAAAFLLWTELNWLLCETFAVNELWQKKWFLYSDEELKNTLQNMALLLKWLIDHMH